VAVREAAVTAWLVAAAAAAAMVPGEAFRLQLLAPLIVVVVVVVVTTLVRQRGQPLMAVRVSCALGMQTHLTWRHQQRVHRRLLPQAGFASTSGQVQGV